MPFTLRLRLRTGMKRISSLAPSSTIQDLADLLATAEFDLPSVRIILHGVRMSQEGGLTLHDDSVEGGGGEPISRTLEQAGIKHGDILEAVGVDKFIERAPTPPVSMPVPPQSKTAEVSPPPASGDADVGVGVGSGVDVDVDVDVGGGFGVGGGGENNTASDEEFARMLYESQMKESENMMFRGGGGGGGGGGEPTMRAPDERRTERLVDDTPLISSLLPPAFTSTLDSLAALDAMMSNRLQTSNQDLYDRGNDTFARMAARRNREISEMLNMAMGEGGEGDVGGAGGVLADLDGSSENAHPTARLAVPLEGAAERDLLASAIAASTRSMSMDEESRVSIPDPDDDVELQRALLRALDEQNYDYEGVPGLGVTGTGVVGVTSPAPAPAPTPAPMPAPVWSSTPIDSAAGADDDLLSAAIAMSITDSNVEEESRLQQNVTGGQSEEDMIAAAIAASLGTK
ncbi:hypothetical protein TrST_g11282 [Triparma strigata]|uniref:Ubiquitin-like domain-containing protein n=1 Tax=Triparma strigata TaxID=1606541 RepID=A0A9W7A4A8_9STRA|nr:hypothetical protein TrST_g11282 [Triparma strigata]